MINGHEYDLEPFEYILTDGNSLKYDDKERDVPICGFAYSMFDVGPTMNVWIAGDIFLTKYFSIYDRKHDQVGLALANHEHK